MNTIAQADIATRSRKKRTEPGDAGNSSIDAASAAMKVTCHQIRDLAYLIYVREGRPDGRHLEHWLEAEAMLKRGAWLESEEEDRPGSRQDTRTNGS